MMHTLRSRPLCFALAAVGLLTLLPGQQKNPPRPPQQKRQPMLLPQAVVLPIGDREIEVDGSLIEWPKLPGLRLNDRRQLSGTAHGAWRGPGDASAAVFLMWSEDALYVACTARDEWHRALDKKTLLLTEIPAADSLVLTFDPNRNTRANGPDPGRRDDRDFWLADDVAREVVQWDRLRGNARTLAEPARMFVLHDKEQQITTYEARIPWSEILPPGKRAQVGLCIDLQMVLNDFDENTDGMAQTRIGWTFGMGPIVDPGLLGSIMLVGDDDALSGVVPPFPAKPGVREPAADSIEYWSDLTAKLIQNPPVLYDGSLTPPETGGLKRFQVLEEIEQHCDRMPRVDCLEMHQRINRRMNREITGLMARGMPRWWRERIGSVSKQGADLVPAGSLRLFRLPMGGWMVRSAKRNFMVDPAGSDIPELCWGGAEMAILTQPLDMTRRNDQLLLRMFTADPVRPVYSHIVYHLPIVAMSKMPLVQLGKTYGSRASTLVKPLSKPQTDGKVTYDCSYFVDVEGQPSLMVMGPSLSAADVEEGSIGVLIASSRNPQAVLIAQKCKPSIVLFDDAFLCQTDSKEPRVELTHLHKMQRALLPIPSVLLAPGESWSVANKDSLSGK